MNDNGRTLRDALVALLPIYIAARAGRYGVNAEMATLAAGALLAFFARGYRLLRAWKPEWRWVLWLFGAPGEAPPPGV